MIHLDRVRMGLQLRRLLRLQNGFCDRYAAMPGSWCCGVPAPIPARVAEKLAGRSFPNFRGFREVFWRAVAATPELAEQFNPPNIARMRNGNAPFVPKSEGSNRGRVWELHHDPAIGRGGSVYDMSNMTIVTPQQHNRIHSGDQR